MSRVYVFHCLVFISASFNFGCGGQRVHITDDINRINRVAVINLADAAGKASPESELFTNEFVSLGFSVVERGHLQDVIKEAFTESGYLDERSVAQWGRGLGIEAVVLHQILSNKTSRDDPDRYDINGWVRMVDVETGKILLTYNTEVVTSTNSSQKAAKRYAESVVDDLSRALQQQRKSAASASRPAAPVQRIETGSSVSKTTTTQTDAP